MSMVLSWYPTVHLEATTSYTCPSDFCLNDIFQHKFDHILEYSKDVIGIADDFCIQGHNEAEHDTHLNHFTAITWEHRFVLNAKYVKWGNCLPPSLVACLIP